MKTRRLITAQSPIIFLKQEYVERADHERQFFARRMGIVGYNNNALNSSRLC